MSRPRMRRRPSSHASRAACHRFPHMPLTPAFLDRADVRWSESRRQAPHRDATAACSRWIEQWSGSVMDRHVSRPGATRAVSADASRVQAVPWLTMTTSPRSAALTVRQVARGRRSVAAANGSQPGAWLTSGSRNPRSIMAANPCGSGCHVRRVSCRSSTTEMSFEVRSSAVWIAFRSADDTHTLVANFGSTPEAPSLSTSAEALDASSIRRPTWNHLRPARHAPQDEASSNHETPEPP